MRSGKSGQDYYEPNEEEGQYYENYGGSKMREERGHQLEDTDQYAAHNQQGQNSG